MNDKLTPTFTTKNDSIKNIPYKSQIITLNLDGVDRQYRVLNVDGNNVEILAMFDVSRFKFGSCQVYARSTLDTYLNTTYYNTLSAEAKNAIVDKTFTQDRWYWGNFGKTVYNGYYGLSNPGQTAYSVFLANETFGEEITRHIYTLSVQDVIDYVTDTSFGRDGQLQNYNIWKMFWDDEAAHFSYVGLRSADASDSSLVWFVDGDYGYMSYNDVSGNSMIRPALTIDLSKISWS